MEGESGATRSIIDELHSSDMVKRKVIVVLLEVSLMNFIFRISKEIKWKEKVVLLEVSLKNFIFGYHQMEGENGVARTIIDEVHSLYMQVDQIEG